MRKTNFENEIFTLTGDKFNALASKIFSYQCKEVEVYQKWVNIGPPKPGLYPYLPIGLFKEAIVLAKDETAEIFFESSSTTGAGVSKHWTPYPDFYEKNFQLGFKQVYGDVSQYSILALLPSYLERSGSSLVYMVEKLIERAAAGSGFYLHNQQELVDQILANEADGIKTILIGVTFALLDLAEFYSGPALRHSIIMETGGMKGRRKEITRMEVHEKLCNSFGVAKIHSEYGMTELMSQAWSTGDGLFHCPPWMQVHIVDVNDMGCVLPYGKTGRICITDLGNLYSCSFIATDDLGKIHADGSFEVLGRLDFSDTRGCNLMV